MLTRDELFRVVCMIFTQSNSMVGTGSFIQKENKYYIATATHVSKDTDDTTLIVFGDINHATFDDKLKDIVIGGWKHHPIADLSVIELDANKLSKYYANRFIAANDVLSNNDISRDVEQTVTGFPRGLGTGRYEKGKFSPLTFRSYPSSNYLTLPRADTGTSCDFYCLENPSMGGYSGGPVFDLGYLKTPLMLQTYGPTLIKGFVHGTMSDNTGGKIALITPSYYLKDLI